MMVTMECLDRAAPAATPLLRGKQLRELRLLGRRYAELMGEPSRADELISAVAAEQMMTPSGLEQARSIVARIERVRSLGYQAGFDAGVCAAEADDDR